MDYLFILDGKIIYNTEPFLEFLSYLIVDQHEIVSDGSSVERFNKLSKEFSHDDIIRYTSRDFSGALPEWVWQLSTQQARWLIKGFIQQMPKDNEEFKDIFITKSQAVADDFQRLCLHAEWSATKQKTENNNYVLIVNKYNNMPVVNGSEDSEIIQFSGNVYCIEVPSHVFYVRRNGKPVWTGNSNRHGQKGTIGALLRGYDMPRTESGLVPDMIMNPHAIPSRMTIAQNLEQLLGKTAALTGAIGDGTSFMNDGSPQEAIGGMLEKNGFEKYGNEILYNGATGEQIPTSIFIGPVYGMRLKHMVEDKWNVRGKGRKEIRTHQPTGGRGAQGGLKIGEMDRDAIIAHGGMSFVKESFMERSDGAKFPICVACGTIPIYNPRLGIAICSLCDGPVKYIGDNIQTMEILPPLGRPKSKIVQVEMPYSTKLLTQEQETFLNLNMRYITTSGLERLNPLEFSGVSTEVIKELPRLILPETTVPVYIEEVAPAVLTVEQLRTMGSQLATMTDAERAVIDTVLDDSNAGIILEQQQQMNAMASLQNKIIMPPSEPSMGVPSTPSVGGMYPPSMPAIINPNQGFSQGLGQGLGQSLGQSLNVIENEGIVSGAQVPGGGPIITVRTDSEAMMADGIMPEGYGFNRQPRRIIRNYGGMRPPQMSQDNLGGGGLPASGGGGYHAPVTITKLE